MAGCGILIPAVLEEIACRGFNSTLMERERKERERERDRESGRVNIVFFFMFGFVNNCVVLLSRKFEYKASSNKLFIIDQ